jgi:hypothetical protein
MDEGLTNGRQSPDCMPCGQAVGELGWVRIHANFDHRDGALALLGLPEGAATPREAVAQALAHWRAQDFETQAALRLPVAASRSHAQWQSLGQEDGWPGLRWCR